MDPITPGAPLAAVVSAAGPCLDPDGIARWIGSRTGPVLVVAVDGGHRHLDAAGVRPHVWIGDFDSVEGGSPASPGPPGDAPCILRHPCEKDATDLELALDHLRTWPSLREVAVFGGIGGRLDHTLANLMVAGRLIDRGLDVTFLDRHHRARLVRGRLDLTRGPLRWISLVPLTDQVPGVSTAGLCYPLAGETLHRESGRGISNELVADQGSIEIGGGRLLVIETDLEDPA